MWRVAREWPVLGRRQMVPSDGESESGSESGSGAGCDSEVFDFVDPLEEVCKQRRREKAPTFGMSEAEALVHALVTSEAELAKRRRVEQDAILAQQLEIEEIRRATREAAELHRRQFQRRWQCSMFLYDNRKLRDFVLMYDMPFFGREAAPAPWKDRLDCLKATRRHKYMARDTYKDHYKRWVPHKLYATLQDMFKQYKAYEWSPQDDRCDLLSAQYLMTHVHLYHVQDPSNPRRVRDVVDYVYNADVSGNRVRMLQEASQWLAVLVQLTMQRGIYYALDRQAVAMILRRLLDDEPPSPGVMMDDITRVKCFVPVTDKALGLANVYYKCDELSAAIEGSASQ